MSKNVAVFVDVANIFYAAKAAGVDIDYVTLLKAASAGRDLVRAYAYTGLDPDNENQRNFHDFLRRSNYKVVSKDIRKYGDGKVKANLDIELVVDMMKTARNLDIAIVVSGDGDFAPAIRAVQEQGVRVEVISFRGNTSSDLIEVADLFTDIIQLARVEKGSRSGRRVADDDADLSMTEVPDKLTEGTGVGRGRGRGRGRSRDAEPAGPSPRGRGRARSTTATPVAADGSAGPLALPGERLSRAVGTLTEADLARAEVFTLDAADDAVTDAIDELDEQDRGPVEDGAEPRRRRRRGGRGRGRGRGRDEDAPIETAEDAPRNEPTPSAPAGDRVPEDEIEDRPAPRAPKGTPFGSVWDSQLGTPTSSAAASNAPILDDEDFDEPEIPEYLIAEQRRGANRGGAGGGRGPRGGRSAYQSAMERERYGRGGGGGINRYPDVSGRTQSGGSTRDERSRGRGAPQEPSRAPRDPAEPWSDVPPELEAMLRAQVAQKPAPARPASEPAVASTSSGDTPEPAVTPAKTRSTRKPAAAKSASTKAAAKPRASRASTKAAAEPGSEATAEAPAAGSTAEKPAPKPRAPRKPKAAAGIRRTGLDRCDRGRGAQGTGKASDDPQGGPGRNRLTLADGRREDPRAGERASGGLRDGPWIRAARRHARRS